MKKQISKFLPLILLLNLFAIGCKKGDSSIEHSNPPFELQNQLNRSTEIVNVKNVPIDAVFYNECCAEAIQVFGTAHFIITSNIIHMQVSNMTGTGLTTNYNYVGQGPSVETIVFYSNQFEGTLTFMLSMNNSNGCSFRLKATLHTTMNQNGNITANIERITTNCD